MTHNEFTLIISALENRIKLAMIKKEELMKNHSQLNNLGLEISYCEGGIDALKSVADSLSKRFEELKNGK